MLLVPSPVVLWATHQTDAALAQRCADGHPPSDADAARVSPLIDAYLNVNGRYALTPPVGCDPPLARTRVGGRRLTSSPPHDQGRVAA